MFECGGGSDLRGGRICKLCLREGKVFSGFDLSLKVFGSYLM